MNKHFITKKIAIFGLAGSLIISCSSKSQADNSTDQPTDSISKLPPVETLKANTNYKPAYEGQYRVKGVKTATKYGFKVIADGLSSPWGLAVLPDGRLLITEKTGTLRLATTSGTLSKPIMGLPKVDANGQGGLLGITVDPNFSKNRMVYFVFAEPGEEGTLTAVGKGKLSSDETKLEQTTVIYRATPRHNSKLHYGGRILFDKSGNLLVSTGERSDLETRPQAQDLNSGLGKIIRITTDGKAAPGNPFLNQKNIRPEIFSYGHRNVQGLAFHPETGDLWETEFGPRGGDELNRIVAGKNFGWPTITYGIEYNGKKIGNAIQQKAGMEQPVYYWDPVISPSGITFYSGKNIPEWKNNLFIACLSGTHIDRLIIQKNKVVGEERLLAREGQRFRDIKEGKDGALYAITDAGKLYRINKEK